MGKLKSLGPPFFAPKVRTASPLWNHTGVDSNLPAPSVLALKIRRSKCYAKPKLHSDSSALFPAASISDANESPRLLPEHQPCRMMVRDGLSPSPEAMELLTAQKMPLIKTPALILFIQCIPQTHGKSTKDCTFTFSITPSPKELMSLETHFQTYSKSILGKLFLYQKRTRSGGKNKDPQRSKESWEM